VPEVGMGQIPAAELERAMKVQEVIPKAFAKTITWWQAAEIIGIRVRSMRRWRARYEFAGYDGLVDRRKGRASGKRVAVELVDQESTRTVMTALKGVVEKYGWFCSLYSDRGSHFFCTPKAGEPVDLNRLTEVGRALRDIGIRMMPSYSPQGRGRSERSFRAWQGRLPQELRLQGITGIEEANRFLKTVYIGEFNLKFKVLSPVLSSIPPPPRYLIAYSFQTIR